MSEISEKALKVLSGLVRDEEHISTSTGHPLAYEHDIELVKTLGKYEFKGDVEEAWEIYDEIASFIDKKCRKIRYADLSVPPDVASELALFKCDLPDLKMKFYVVAFEEADAASGRAYSGLTFHKNLRKALKDFTSEKKLLKERI